MLYNRHKNAREEKSMNKRQIKKNNKKYIPIIADEVNLLTMTKEESEKALMEFNKFRERFAYRKKYKDLEEGRPLVYYFSPGEKVTTYLQEISNIARRSRKTSTVVQNIKDFKID